MKVIFLAAGRSKRMNPIPDKNFLEFCGRPLIYHQFKALISAGFDDFVIVGGVHNFDHLCAFEKSDEVLALFTHGKERIAVVEQKDLDQGMAGAVLAARSHVNDEPIMIVNSNDIVDSSAYQAIIKASYDENFESFMIGKHVSKYFPGGYIKVDADSAIKGIVEKPDAGNEPSDMVNLVIHVHKNPSMLFEYLERAKSSNDDLYEVALDSMIQDGVRIKAISYDGAWHAIKYPWHVMEVARNFFDQAPKGIANDVEIAASAVVKGDVIIEKGVRIFDGAMISGPCFIGEGSIVANNALVRDSYIGRHCVVGFSTEVARSYLGNDVWLHTNYIGDSIVCDNCSFGSGAVTGNLRLDEKNIAVEVHGKKMDCGSNKFGCVIGPNVRVGINTSLMPGVKIGSGSFIGSGIVIGQNIPDNSFVNGKWNLKIVPNKATVETGTRKNMRNSLQP